MMWKRAVTAWAMLTSLKIKIDGQEKLLLDLNTLRHTQNSNFNHSKLMLGVYSHLVLEGVILPVMFYANLHRTESR